VHVRLRNPTRVSAPVKRMAAAAAASANSEGKADAGGGGMTVTLACVVLVRHPRLGERQSTVGISRRTFNCIFLLQIGRSARVKAAGGEVYFIPPARG